MIRISNTEDKDKQPCSKTAHPVHSHSPHTAPPVCNCALGENCRGSLLFTAGRIRVARPVG
jgi:hypothetical protein